MTKYYRLTTQMYFYSDPKYPKYHGIIILYILSIHVNNCFKIPGGWECAETG